MIKTRIEFGLKKPILNHFFLFFILVLSIFAYFNIPKEIFLPSNMDAVSITGSYAGASSDLLDKIAVEDIEDELLSLSFADKITSVIKNGYFSIMAELKSAEDSNLVVDEVKSEIIIHLLT
jgi:multidrug efflux pump subunit AcrB